MKFNLIIPSVGLGTRFLNSGYKSYKAFIDIFGSPMISYVSRSMGIEINTIIIAAKSKKDVFENYRFADNVKLVFIEDHKNGPSFSIQQISHLLNSNEAYFVAYNDIFWEWDISLLFEFISREDPDGIVFTHCGFHPHLYRNNFSAFCRTHGDNILEIREKASFTDDWMSELLSIGVFYYKTGVLLKESINFQIQNDLKSAAEYYPSLTFNYLIKNNFKIRSFPVSKFVHWGVPEQLDDAIHWFKVFKNSNHNCTFDVLMMMCGTGERMKTVSQTNKAGIEVAEKKMYKYVLEILNCRSYSLLVNDNTIALTENHERKINVEKQTLSQTHSLQLAKKDITKFENTIFASNDCFGFIDYQDLACKIDSDIVLFGFKPSLLQQKLDSAHSYFEIDGEFVSDILIKEITKNGLGLAGLFFVSNGKIFEYIQELDESQNPSFDHFVKFLLSIGKKIKFTIIDDYVHLGSPLELKEFLFWRKFYENFI